MDELDCCAYPQVYSSNSASDSSNDQEHVGSFSDSASDSSNNQLHHFNVEFEYSRMHVLNASKFDTLCNVEIHRFSNIPKDEIMQETTIVSWLSHMGVPRNAHSAVVAKVLQCARDMVSDTTETHTHILCMRVDVIITNPKEDGISDSDSENYDDEEDNQVVEEEEEDEEDYGFVPAAKTLVERLETTEHKGLERCAICFEDFHVGVSMPCLHMFHKSCISEWLQIGHSCPLCRFKMPTRSD
ncbi:hypothetical protein VNO80_26420 [Phaseolus coccineus]|uniref:RING-type E3 ubiquitin transferase n=1 Tax=Phaseolus coccineus TaxID=3886 RepID=A0AAN9LI59_PHACN